MTINPHENILMSKKARMNMSMKRVRAWWYFLNAKWPYASTRQVERQQRQMRKRLTKS